MKITETQNLECWNCTRKFPWTPTDGWKPKPRLCDSCVAEEIERNFQDALDKARNLIAKRTPARYQGTDTGHPDFNTRLWARVQGWMPAVDRPWLGMTGATGKSKTRCAFLILRDATLGMIRPAVDPDSRPRIPTIAVTTAYQFAEAVAGKYGDARSDSEAFLHRLRVADIALIDDLGKQRNTPAVCTELFAALDHRHEENRLTIWTANTSPEGFLTGMQEDMAAPLAGRIRECSTIINLA